MQQAADAMDLAATRFEASGEHWLLDCHDVPMARLTDAAMLEALLREAAIAAGASILFSHFHRFEDERTGDAHAGVTGVVLLAESHLTIHTWPEHGFAAIDLFLCGATQPARAVACIARGLDAARIVERRQRRGLASRRDDARTN